MSIDIIRTGVRNGRPRHSMCGAHGTIMVSRISLDSVKKTEVHGLAEIYTKDKTEERL